MVGSGARCGLGPSADLVTSTAKGKWGARPPLARFHRSGPPNCWRLGEGVNMSETGSTPPKKKRKGLIILLVILGILLVFGGGCAVLVGVVFKSAGDAVDPANNAKTGLVDGSYLLTTNGSYAKVNDSCAFSGEVEDGEGAVVASDIRVVGNGEMCALGSDTSLVAFVVSGGQAAIVEVK